MQLWSNKNMFPSESISKIVFECIVIGLFVTLVTIMIWWFRPSYSCVKSDYTKSIKVDSISKVEQAISNAIHDVESRNFIMIGLDVSVYNKRNFEITCRGVDRGNLLKSE